MIISTLLSRISLMIIFLSINSYAIASSIPHMVKDINPNGDAYIENLISMNNEIFFSATDGINTNGRALWKSDGTEEGTVMVKDINPSQDGSTTCGPINLTVMNRTLFFTAGNTFHYPPVGTDIECNNELWMSDGTSLGTVLVKDIWPGDSSSYPRQFTVLDNIIFFTAKDSSHGRELWKSDGTEEGTVMVKDIDPGSIGLEPLYLTVVNNVLYFSANDGNGYELWKSDGTEEGTVMVKDINPVNDWYFGSRPEELTNLNGILLFEASDGVHGRELWKSDGTEEGTVMVKDIMLDSYGHSYPSGFTVVNDILFFIAVGNLWKSDGTETGTAVVKEDIQIHPVLLYEINGMLFFWFSYYSSSHWERQLWKSDGTDLGTVIVKIIYPPNSANVGHLIDVNGTAFFLAEDEIHGDELWKSNGTESGTVMVADINPGIGNASPNEFLYHNDVLYFQARDEINNYELWALPAPTEIDDDAISDGDDNCPLVYNPNQEDTYPPQGNGIGDACECEADFDCNGNVDALDLMNFLWDFGRSAHYDPCTNLRWCYGDFDCNGAVDSDDLTKFLEDFGRGQYSNTCPACEVGNWCSY